MNFKKIDNTSRFRDGVEVIRPTFSYGIIYIYSIPDNQHRGRLKIGSATLTKDNPTQTDIDKAAHERIRQQTKTADVNYVLEHAELALTNSNQYLSDFDVHNVLIRSGYKRKSENTKNSHSEWFEIDLSTAKKAILAAKEGRKALTTSEQTSGESTFEFRPNQLEAIRLTNKAISQRRKHYLWNAKMRFGKTSAAMQVARENNFGKVLIVTHRPSVSTDWFDDFKKVFSGTDYEYSSKTKGESIQKRLSESKPFVYFASLQDLRLSESVVSDENSGSKARGYKKNDEIFDTLWDMVIVDEAHEGTQSNLGDTTLSKIPYSFMLELSGTPFNIIHKREEDEVYTWDYVMEQYEKVHWDENHPGVPNPYEELPALTMFTYDIDKFSTQIGNLNGFTDLLDGAFKFHEFFRVEKDNDGNDTAKFIHESMVYKFLDLLVDEKLKTSFPYSTEEYRSYNKHSLWLLPNRTKTIEAMEKLLRNHPVFRKFGVVNISGDAKVDDAMDSDAKSRVQEAIKSNDYTITLTGQRLTTGASIPEWTAVFMMSDTSSATTYLQTAFRCQTPARVNGQLKTQGYVFDFAPDRTLRLIAEAIELNHKTGKTNSPEQRKAMSDFLNFCPILASEGGSMKRYDVSSMLNQLKKAIIERVSQNGFDDPRLYNDELLKLDEVDIDKFNELRKIVGSSNTERTNEIKINEHGMDVLEAQKAEEAERKKKKKLELSAEEKEALRKLKEAREQKKSAISILRAVSIRMPMMVYGANVSVREDITLKKFIDLVDDESWKEFMPAGLTKEEFNNFTKYYDEDVFRGVAHNIRAKAFDYENLLPTERIQAIAEIFSTFKNPDKETVLTPWNVVNMQMSMTLGGSDFRSIIKDKPEWITQKDTTSIWSNPETKILEINSKSGLYPLLAAYNLYSRELIKLKKPEIKVHRQLWNEILEKNIYVLCKSPMAKTITERTLAGYTKSTMNVVYVEDLIKKLRLEGKFKGYNITKELQEKFGIEGKNMRFTAVVGNPPYQINDSGGIRDDGSVNSSASPIYNKFVETALSLDPKNISLIIPARWLSGAGKGLKEFSLKMLKDRQISNLTVYTDSKKIFNGVDIKGGVCFFLWQKGFNGKTQITINSNGNNINSERYLDDTDMGVFILYQELQTILDKIKTHTDIKYNNIQTITSVLKPYGLRTDVMKNTKKYGLPEFYDHKKHNNDLEIWGLESAKRVLRYLPIDYPIPLGRETLGKWKVFLPYAYGAGAIGETIPTPILGTPILGTPIQICTETFLRIGLYDSEREAKNLIKYIRTKFFRAMVGVLKTTQHATTTFRLVPLQDFTIKSDIDWSRSITEIDRQLYKKYNLNEDEIDFIETHVKAME